MIDFEEHMGALYFVALSMVNNHHDAEDLVQDTILKSLKKMHLFDGKRPKSWMCMIMKNIMIDRYRRKRRVEMRVLDAEVMEQIFGEAPDHAKDEVDPKIISAVDGLKDCYKIVLLMRAEGKTCREIAVEISKPRGTVMSRLQRAREFIKDELRTAA